MKGERCMDGIIAGHRNIKGQIRRSPEPAVASDRNRERQKGLMTPMTVTDEKF
jgi:hypothetical protein